jgi:hypothetical protein
MADAYSELMVLLQLADIVVAAYLLKVLLSAALRHHGTFSKTMKTMLVAVLLFFLVEVVQLFRVADGTELEFIQSAFSFAFLLLLLMATLEIQRGVLAHDHLVRRKAARSRVSDVE